MSTGWWQEQRDKHTLFVAEEVLVELSHPEFRRRADAAALVHGIPLLPTNQDVRGLARILVREKVMPGPIAGDAVHVAVATVHRMEYVLTWNVRHLANVNKLEHLRVVCRRAGYVPPQIVTPEILWDYQE